MSIKEHEKEAIHSFLIHATLPILGIVKVEDRLEEALIGTGTLFKIIGGASSSPRTTRWTAFRSAIGCFQKAPVKAAPDHLHRVKPIGR